MQIYPVSSEDRRRCSSMCKDLCRLSHDPPLYRSDKKAGSDGGLQAWLIIPFLIVQQNIVCLDQHCSEPWPLESASRELNKISSAQRSASLLH